MRRYRTAAISAVAIALIGAGIADAHRTSYKTSSSIGFAENPTAALGFVNSPKAKCVKRRLVKLYKVRRGKDRLVGKDRSGVPSGSGKGFWEVRRNLKRGRYYAKVVRKNIGRGKHRHICRAYRTSILPYSKPAR
jgi:hypothetical protein